MDYKTGVSAVFLAVALFLAVLLNRSIAMTHQAWNEVDILRAVVIDKEHDLSGAEYRRSELAKRYEQRIKALKNEIEITHELYQKNIQSLGPGNEMSRREGMTKLFYTGCLYRFENVRYCSGLVASAYQDKFWEKVDQDARDWDRLWALIQGLISG